MAASTASSQARSDALSVALTHQKVALVDGKEALVEAKSAKPGDVIEYRATYRNESDKPLQSVEATLPVPVGTAVLPASLAAGATASLDGSGFQPIPLKRRVKQSNGKEVEVLVPYSEYRFLRWKVGSLDSGKSAVYVARVKVNESGAAQLGSQGAGR
jgi:uncharacterized repeat protein (TIGR01451 family)